jgi:hypothetical protein
MKQSVAAGLTALVLASIAVRLSPLWSFVYWGSDTGEYFAILRVLVQTGHVSTRYYGWGVTYPYFPGMFFVQAGFADLAGLDVPTVLNLLVPILGAVSVVPMFLIARRITGDDRVALFAAALLVGAIPQAYTTAHAAPATLGDLLAFSGLLLFLRLRTDGTAIVPLVVVSGALIATHHLSLYFFLLMVLGTIIVRGLARPWHWTPGAKREIAFAAILLAGTFAYWLAYATTFREFILTDVSIRPWWALLVLFAAAVLVLAVIVYARARIPWRYRPRYPGLPYRGSAYASAVGIILILGLVSVLFGVPGTTFRVSPEGLIYFVPLVLLISFSAPGRKFLDFEAEGVAPNAWLVALIGSAVVGIAVAPHVLIPYRHMEYLMVPFAIFAGIGFFRLLDLSSDRRRWRAAACAAIGLIFVANAFTGVPPPATLAGWREGTISAALDPAYWARDHASGLVVSDHHGSTTVFGFGGLNATWDRTRSPFFPGSDPYAGLSGIDSPSGPKDGTYVWIDRDMEAGLRLTPWETAAPMDPTVIAKFDTSPFLKVFDNGYARLYWIAWGCSPTTC